MNGLTTEQYTTEIDIEFELEQHRVCTGIDIADRAPPLRRKERRVGLGIKGKGGERN